MKKLLLGSALALSLVGTAGVSTAHADSTWYDTGDWKVWQFNSNRGPTCQIQTKVQTTTGVAWIGVGANGLTKEVLLMWGEPNWHWNSNQAHFTVQIDNYPGFNLDMTQFDNKPGVLGAPLNGDPAIRFINELYAGQMLTIHTGSGDRKFPMYTSKGAMTAMGQCMTSINTDHMPHAVPPVQVARPYTPPRVAALPRVAPDAASVAKQLN
jgi:hypothetical protein